MKGTPDNTSNTPASIKARYATSRISWWPVLLFLPGRLIFSLIAQGVVAALFAFRGATNPWLQAAAWWTVYLTLADLLCLLALVWLTRREGMTLMDLVGVRGRAIIKQLAWAPLYLLAIAPAAGLASIVTRLFYGRTIPPYLGIVDVPLAGALYSVLIWPIIWAVTEELVYLGYLLPRLKALSGKTWIAVLVVTFFWGLQHLANPFIPGWTYVLARVLAAMVAVGGVTLVFAVWRRNLIAMIAAHYIIDLGTAFTIALLPLLRS
jgi:membrane protease YdiL (CAAX protease family)